MLTRIYNLVVGFLGLFVSGLEKKNPAIAYENTIESMTKKFIQVRGAAAGIIRHRDQLATRIENNQRELADITQQLEAALQTDQDDLAAVLVEKQDDLKAAIAEDQVELTRAQKDADDVKSSLTSLQSQIEGLKVEKNRAIAKLGSADAKLAAQEMLDGVSIDAELKALDNVRTHVANRVAEANLATELNDNDINNRLAKLKAKSGSITAASRVQALKAERGLTSSLPAGSPVVKSMGPIDESETTTAPRQPEGQKTM